MFKKFRRKLARLIFDDKPQNVVHIRDYSPSADRNARLYDEAMKWHRAEFERTQGKRPLTAVK